VAKKLTRAKKGGPRKVSKAGRKKTSRPAPKRARGDASRLDLHPLQAHIQKRIDDLETKRTMRAGAEATPDDAALERLKQAKQLFADICYPTMTIPI
jgi:hypothetical protein